MPEEKRMDETSYEEILKELNAVGELIRTRQDEKQAAMDEFEKEKLRFETGKVSEKAFSTSVKKVNAEFDKIDSEIDKGIKNVHHITDRIKEFVGRQAPKRIKATMEGLK